MDETQPDDSDIAAPAGIIVCSSSVTEESPVIPSVSLKSHSQSQEQDVADTMGKLSIAQESASQDEVMGVSLVYLRDLNSIMFQTWKHNKSRRAG
jgi:hypothetical protein